MAINTEKIKAIIGTEEMKNYKVLLRQLFAEFLGTFLYLALISLSVFPEITATLTRALSKGLVVGSVIQIIGHVSGGHINPAVTFGVLVTDQIKMLRALCYVVAQVLGAIAGTFLSSATLNKYSDIPDDYFGYNRRVPNVRVPKLRVPVVRSPDSLRIESIKDYQILLLEFLMSFTLVLVVLSVVDTKRGARGLGSAALAIGLCLAACQCSCQFYPAILNPVVSIGFAVVFNVLTDHWVYWLGPIFGGICAGLFYRFVFSIKMTSSSDS